MSKKEAWRINRKKKKNTKTCKTNFSAIQFSFGRIKIVFLKMNFCFKIITDDDLMTLLLFMVKPRWSVLNTEIQNMRYFEILR